MTSSTDVAEDDTSSHDDDLDEDDYSFNVSTWTVDNSHKHISRLRIEQRSDVFKIDKFNRNVV